MTSQELKRIETSVIEAHPIMASFRLTMTHRDRISAGDVIQHGGKPRTLSRKDIKHSSFMGVSILGDTYQLGQQPVLCWRYNDPRRRL